MDLFIAGSDTTGNTIGIFIIKIYNSEINFKWHFDV